jgi:hypothetical protein
MPLLPVLALLALLVVSSRTTSALLFERVFSGVDSIDERPLLLPELAMLSRSLGVVRVWFDRAKTFFLTPVEEEVSTGLSINLYYSAMTRRAKGHIEVQLEHTEGRH